MSSEHFTIQELTFSQFALRHGISNTPNDQQLANLERLRDALLEPGRILLGELPWHIDSGYRAPSVNAAIGGATDSAHMDGRAADVIPKGISLLMAFDKLRVSSLPYDQIILECNAWIHLAIARVGVAPRRQALLAHGQPGAWAYVLAPPIAAA